MKNEHVLSNLEREPQCDTDAPLLDVGVIQIGQTTVIIDSQDLENVPHTETAL